MNKSKEFLLKNIIFSSKVLNKNSNLEHVINKSVFTFFEHKKDTDLECFLNSCNVNPKEALWIVTTNEEIAIANEYNISVLGYQNLNDISSMNEFLKCEYVVCGFDEVDDNYLENIYRRGHNIPLIIFETKRCIIREFEPKDMDALWELYSDPEITEYIDDLFPYDEELEYENKYIEHIYRYFGYGMWLVFHKETGKLIGRAGIESKDYQEGSEIEMGYVIAKEYQKKGYATEVCQGIMEYAMKELDIKKINCLIDKNNYPSIALAKKLGFKYDENCWNMGENMQRYIYWG